MQWITNQSDCDSDLERITRETHRLDFIRDQRRNSSKRIGKKVEQVKVKLTYGSKAGLIGPEMPPDAKEVWKTEGPTDLLAFLSMDGLPTTTTAICNANGAKEDPARAFQWLPKNSAERVSM